MTSGSGSAQLKCTASGHVGFELFVRFKVAHKGTDITGRHGFKVSREEILAAVDSDWCDANLIVFETVIRHSQGTVGLYQIASVGSGNSCIL